MSHLFISYARADGSDFAEKLYQMLKLNHLNPWLDVRHIPEGSNWDNALDQAIQECAMFLFMITPASVESENCMDEIHNALRHKKTILPLLMMSVPDNKIPFRIARIQRIDFISDFSEGFRRLQERLKHIGVPASATEPVIDTSHDDVEVEAEQLTSDEQARINSQYTTIRQSIMENFMRDVQLASKLQLFLHEHPDHDVDNLAEKFLEYLPLNVDLDMSYSIDEDFVINQDHALWTKLSEAGATLKGNMNRFPVQTKDRVGFIEYRVRRPFTESGKLVLGQENLLNIIKTGDKHPFWRSVGLGGVPMLWGSAAVVYRKDADGIEILLGIKQPRTKRVQAVYAGQLTPPAGIVDIEDFEFSEKQTLGDVLIVAALRELYEETGLAAEHDWVRGVKTFFEIDRCKQQAFVLIEIPPDTEIPDNISPELIDIDYYDLTDRGVILSHDLSPECMQSVVVLNQFGLIFN